MTKGISPDEQGAAATSGSAPYELRLYVAGGAPSSTRAVEGLRAICEELLPGRYTLQVIDIYQQPALAQADHVVAVPVLIKLRPSPPRRILGDLADRARVLAGLDLAPKPHEERL